MEFEVHKHWHWSAQCLCWPGYYVHSTPTCAYAVQLTLMVNFCHCMNTALVQWCIYTTMQINIYSHHHHHIKLEPPLVFWGWHTCLAVSTVLLTYCMKCLLCTEVCFIPPSPADLLRTILCGGEPIQVVAYIHRKSDWHVQGQEKAGTPTSCLCNHWCCLQKHATRSVLLKPALAWSPVLVCQMVVYLLQYWLEVL